MSDIDEWYQESLEECNKLRAENAELRKLVKTPVYAFTESEWKEWCAQHSILKEQP